MNTQTKKPTKRAQAISLFLTQQDAELQQYLSLTIITYTSAKGQPCAAVWSEKGYKPQYRYAFKDEPQRSEFIQTLKTKEVQREEEKRARMKTYEKEKTQYQKGQILACSWGYEQTNINFYLILERKGDFVTIVEIGQHRKETGFMSGEAMPDRSRIIGEPMRRKITQYATINLASYKYCALWEGKPMYWSSYA